MNKELEKKTAEGISDIFIIERKLTREEVAQLYNDGHPIDYTVQEVE